MSEEIKFNKDEYERHVNDVYNAIDALNGHLKGYGIPCEKPQFRNARDYADHFVYLCAKGDLQSPNDPLGVRINIHTLRPPF